MVPPQGLWEGSGPRGPAHSAAYSQQGCLIWEVQEFGLVLLGSDCWRRQQEILCRRMRREAKAKAGQGR